MQKLRYTLKNSVLSLLMVFVLSVFVPMSAYADTTNPDTTATTTPTQTVTEPVVEPVIPPVIPPTPPPTETAPAPTAPVAPTNGATNTGTKAPTGAASNTFALNPDTGLWENDYYIWDPATKQTRPKSSQTYSYNPTTNKWDTTDWQYSPTAGKYVPNTYAVTQPPAGAKIDSSSIPANYAPNSPSGGSGSVYDSFFNGTISNNNTTQATTGNALIDGNTYAGNAGTGNATSMANLFNLLQSSTNFLGSGAMNTFNANIQGDVLGDLLINPGTVNQLSAGPSSSPVGSLTVNNQTNGAINNNLTVGANTGNATITNNTAAGNATTGNANAVANVINMLNSAVNTGQSFLGAINIYGNLNGDILLPTGFLDTLLASNAPSAAAPATTCTTGCEGGSSAVATNVANNSSIKNNINSDAATGNATIASNTTAGNATTGNAMSNVTLLNLTGHEVVGKNDLLVFVNVLGKWYGMIMNAPAGATAASVGGGISQNTNNGCSSCNATLNDTNNSAINNNIDISAASGDATIANNTKAGNATTGNATTSVNLANFIDSHLALSDWFGILFINVFGTWNGSFGVDTAAGTAPVAAAPAGDSGSSNAAASNTTKQMFSFIPKATAAASAAANNGSANDTTAAAATQDDDATAVLGATDNDTSGPSTPAATMAAQGTPSWLMPIIGSLIAALLLGAEQVITRRQKQQAGLPVVSSTTGHITTA